MPGSRTGSKQRAFAIEDMKVPYQYLAAFRRRLREAARSGGMTGEYGEHARTAPLATILNHFPLFNEFDETIGILNFSGPALDKLRQEILLLYARTPDLESEAVERHLMETGCAHRLQVVLSPAVFVSAWSAQSESDAKMARTGL